MGSDDGGDENGGDEGEYVGCPKVATGGAFDVSELRSNSPGEAGMDIVRRSSGIGKLGGLAVN